MMKPYTRRIIEQVRGRHTVTQVLETVMSDVLRYKRRTKELERQVKNLRKELKKATKHGRF